MENEMTDKSEVLNELTKEINSVGVKNVSPIKKALWILYCDVDGYEHISIDAMVELTTQAETIAKLREALEGLLEVCACQNGCDPSDMSCATMKARAILAETESQ